MQQRNKTDSCKLLKSYPFVTVRGHCVVWFLSCFHRVEGQASLGGGGPGGLVCQVELGAAGPEARME